MSPETRLKSSGTFEKRVRRRERYPKTHVKMQERGTSIICFSNNIAEFTGIFLLLLQAFTTITVKLSTLKVVLKTKVLQIHTTDPKNVTF